jgi:hypothetical protein
MSFYLETDLLPNEDSQEKIDSIIYNNDFPWYFEKTTSSLKYRMFFHSLVLRQPHKESPTIPVQGKISSPHFDFFFGIFLDVCKKNNIDVNVIYRACINNTWHYPEKHGDIHVDHKYPHKQFIWYLNDFTDAPTYLFDENNNLIKKTAVGKNKINIFSNERHAQGFCAPGEYRICVVFTFN